jgi:large subunit ribosomal protein L9
MKVIMLKDVKGVGKVNQIIEVKDGYASNYLLPNRLAVKYTERSIEVLEDQKKNEQLKIAELTKKAQEKAKLLETITVEFKAKSGSDGRMIGTISNKQIEKELLDKYHIEIDKRKFVDNFKVNAFGITNLKIELYKNVYGTVKVHVSEEK